MTENDQHLLFWYYILPMVIILVATVFHVCRLVKSELNRKQSAIDGNYSYHPYLTGWEVFTPLVLGVIPGVNIVLSFFVIIAAIGFLFSLLDKPLIKAVLVNHEDKQRPKRKR